MPHGWMATQNVEEKGRPSVFESKLDTDRHRDDALYGSGDIGEFVNDLANSHPFVRQES